MMPEMWNTILSAVLIILIGAVGWLTRTVIWSAGEIKKINAVLRITEVNEEIDTVHKRVSRLGEKVSEVAGKMQSIERTTDLINQHLMSGNK